MENRNKSKIPAISTFEELGYKAVLLIGAFQVLALIPGTSRSGATILFLLPVFRFKAFGYYRIILGLIVVLYFLAVR